MKTYELWMVERDLNDEDAVSIKWERTGFTLPVALKHIENIKKIIDEGEGLG